MSATFAITTLIELAVAILLVYGFMHEEKFIAFEQAVKRIVIASIYVSMFLSFLSFTISLQNFILLSYHLEGQHEAQY